MTNTSDPSPPATPEAASSRPSMRLVTIAVGYGAVAGAVAAGTYLAMGFLEELVWSPSSARWYVATVVLVGGIILALLRPHLDAAGLDAQLEAAADPVTLRRRRTAVLALGAVVAVAFGGAVGPEAGLLAVVAELSAIVSHQLARSHAEERLIGQAGSVAALAGLYGSPPGAAAYDGDDLTPPKALPFLAGVAGFVTFLATVRALGHGGTGLQLPDYPGVGAADLVLSIVPGLVAAAAAYGYVRVRPGIVWLLARCGSPRVQTLVGSVVFAGLATCWPLLRFSGHEDFGQVVAYADASAWAMLAALALLKLTATAVCVSSGWLGGEFFPLMLAGAAAGAAALVVVPALPLTGAMAAGLGAATAVGLRKPLAALLIGALILGGDGVGPLMVGVAVAVAVLRAVPLPAHQRSAGH